MLITDMEKADQIAEPKKKKNQFTILLFQNAKNPCSMVVHPSLAVSDLQLLVSELGVPTVQGEC